VNTPPTSEKSVSKAREFPGLSYCRPYARDTVTGLLWILRQVLEHARSGVAKRSARTDQRSRLCGADHKIVKIAAHLESARLFDPADPHRLKARRSDQVLDFVAPMLVLGHVEQNRGLGRPVARGLEEIGRHGAERNGKACPDRQPPSNNLAR